MKSSHAKKASITLPSGLEEELQRLAQKEQRTLSGLLQEAARRYLLTRQWDDLQRETSPHRMKKGVRTEDEVDKMIHEWRIGR